MDIIQMQKQVREFDEKHDWFKDKPSQIALHAVEELGELARELLKEEGYKKGKADKKEISNELMDLLYLILKLANKYDLKLDEEWRETLERYAKKYG
ncbi:MAG: MazG-like family protein [Candidatus Altiarchaeota archaeon]